MLVGGLQQSRYTGSSCSQLEFPTELNSLLFSCIVQQFVYESHRCFRSACKNAEHFGVGSFMLQHNIWVMLNFVVFVYFKLIVKMF